MIGDSLPAPVVVMLRHHLLASVFTAAVVAAQSDPLRAEIVVYGGTSGGVVAAVQAARLGRDVLLLEPTAIVGGLSSCGLGATDSGDKASVGGVSREFYQRLRQHYAQASAWRHERPEGFAGRGHRPGEDAVWTFEPHVAEAVFEQMLDEAGVRVIRDARLDLGGGGVSKDGTRIIGLRVLVDGAPTDVEGAIFVDATYEGDLLGHAGVSYHVGREANSEYGETLNGVQVRNAVKHQFAVDVDPYVIPGDPGSGLLPGIAADGPGAEGSEDARVQAYCFRLCTTDVPSNRAPWPKPDNYDEADFELLLRNFEAGDHRVPWHRVLMPNRKTDTNNNFAISTDAIGLNYRWPEADWEERDAIFAAHLYYTQGLLWTLANHERVPPEVRAEFQEWGPARDEWPQNAHWPPQLYVREGRRMVSDVVMTERHCRGLDRVDDSVGLGSYGMDSHNVQRYVDESGRVRNEGDVQVHGFDPYAISYRAIRPRRTECTNLLVPVAVSSSHIAFGSIRMEPVFMVLGHSAATAADLALETSVAVQDVDQAELEKRLLAEGQVLRWAAPPRALIGADPSAIDGVVVDDSSATLEGGWTASRSQSPFVAYGYVHDGKSGDGRSVARFELWTTSPGRYRVDVAYTPHANRASSVPVSVRHAETRLDSSVDQRNAPDFGGLWQPVGSLDVSADEAVLVEIRNDATDGYVVVDAVRLVPSD